MTEGYGPCNETRWKRLPERPHSIAVQQRSETVALERARGRAKPPIRIKTELEINLLLRWDASAVRRAAASHLGRVPADAVETFTAICDGKTGFNEG